MPVTSARRGQRRASPGGVGNTLPLRRDASAAPCGRARRRTEQCGGALQVGAGVMPGNQGSHCSAGAKDSGLRLHHPPRKLLIRPCQLISGDFPLWI